MPAITTTFPFFPKNDPASLFVFTAEMFSNINSYTFVITNNDLNYVIPSNEIALLLLTKQFFTERKSVLMLLDD